MKHITVIWRARLAVALVAMPASAAGITRKSSGKQHGAESWQIEQQFGHHLLLTC